ncbi:strictosidine synthase domain-containing protein [Cyclospora cayetanensis]|uniref:Strictosidine synthase domain-containing protein n=1 Tax=Cyclospora cayetanensis TaxID=88456 RepID=A0A1D3D3K2_9EIME|nr:strictosidine synthase domain-containing protein [Cyclospora cayetanensis]
MGFIASSALAVGAAAAVVFAIIIAFHDLALERLRRFCIPTAKEAEWAAAYVEVADEDVDVLSYGEEELGGAESFLEEPEGFLLTSLWDGRIVRLLTDRKMQHVASTGSHHGVSCSRDRQKRVETRCSRPLGLQFASTPRKEDKTFSLVVCDGWRGLLQVSVPSSQQIEAGVPPTPSSHARQLLQGANSQSVFIPNAITEQVDGRFFVTDSSEHSDASRFGLIPFEGANSGTGRLLSVDLQMDTAEVVGDAIPFANGAVLSYDRSGVLVAALNPREIRFYPLKPANSQDWKLVKTLPVPPDNLTRVPVNGQRLYAAVSFGAAFLPPFFVNSDADGLWQQLRAAAWTALSRATRPYKPFPLFGGLLFPVMRLLPASFFDFLIKFGARKSKRGGQVLLFDERGKLHKWLSLPPKCRYSSEAILHKWPGATEPVMLIGAFRPEQPLCQIKISKYLSM